MLTLSRRECRVAGKHSGNTTEKDGVTLRTLTFQLDEIPLDATELNCLLGEPHAHRALYNTRRDGGIEPFLRCIKAIEFDKAIEGAHVTLHLGRGSELAFTDCKLTKVKFVLGKDRGETLLSCKVTTAPTLDETLAELFEQFGEPAECELRAEPPTAQQDLPLSRHGEGEQPETGKRKRGRNGNGRRPAAH